MSLLKIIIVFCVIFVASKFAKKWIAMAIFTGAVLSGLLFGFGFKETFRAFLEGTVSQNAVFLAVLVTLISVFSGVMDETGILEKCKKASVTMFSSGRGAGVFMASLIGFLPMPGGALFSAPLVKSSIEGENPPGLLTALNYWFRHVWEFWWPLYPAVITLLAVTRVGMFTWIANTIVFSFFAIFFGWIFLYRKVHASKMEKKPFRLPKEALSAFTPLFSVILFAVIYKILLFLMKTEIQTELVIIPSVLFGILLCIGHWKKTMNLRRAVPLNRIVPLAIMILTIIGYKQVIEKAAIAQSIATDIQNLNLPVLAVFAFLPFIAGLITGIAIGFIGASFPLIIDMLNDFPQYSKTAVLVLSFGFGYAGMMLSPFHACLLLSKEYFCSSWKDTYKYLLLPTAALTGVFVVYYILAVLFFN